MAKPLLALIEEACVSMLPQVQADNNESPLALRSTRNEAHKLR